MPASPMLARRLISLAWSDDRATRLRLRQWSLTLGMYLSAATVVCPFVPGPTILLWVGFVLAGSIPFYLLIRSGWSQRLEDPAISQAQIVHGFFAVMLAYAVAGDVRSAALFPLMMMQTFGAFVISWRRMIHLTAFALAGIGLVMIGMHRLHPGRYSATVDLANFLVLAITMPGSAIVAATLGGLRARLREQSTELQAALVRIQEHAIRDELTGLVNRRRGQELLSLETARADRQAAPLVVALIDIDHFKQVNDQHGHGGGDQALKAFADIAVRSLRATDLVARWGGEEFLVLLPDTSLGAACGVIDRLRSRIEESRIPHSSGEIAFTLSAGIALHLSGRPATESISRADRALYAAKARGRNRLVCDEPPLPPRTAPAGLRPRGE